MFKLRCFWLLSLVFVVVVGCGDGATGPPEKPPGVKVAGKILLPNGSPLTGGVLTLTPEVGLRGATGTIGADGSFSLQESGTPEIVPGRYQVFVRIADPELAKAVPAKYLGSSEDVVSDVVVDIQAATDNLMIKLKP